MIDITSTGPVTEYYYLTAVVERKHGRIVDEDQLKIENVCQFHNTYT